MSEAITLQKALYTIKKLKNLLLEQHSKKFEPVAIVGLSCRFPQAVGKNAYWELLQQGRNIISNMPKKRWELLEGSDEIGLRDNEHPYWGGFLSDVDAFDAYYFGISPREAIRIDPQHRLMLEVAHEAIEDAGIPIDSLAGSNTGVFASLYVSQLAHQQKMDAEMDALYLPTGNAISIAANRISYLFDLQGPSIIVDSACSSSMASLYLACLNLQNQACDLALVCGAKLNLLPYVNYVLSKAKMLSPDGQCKTFDASANGYVQGEGVGVVVLKPLAKALEDCDRIYGVIAGSSINQDGRTNGLTAPNGLQQEKLLTKAYQTAGINPEEISYVECHGTGTFLGDPIEIQALGAVVGKNRDNATPCYIGSVKTNIGHLEPAAGIASIIKVALALKNKQIPPHLNFSTPNPHIAFDKYHFRVPTQLQDWPVYGETRLAGLSGFGFGGTNAHLVMRDLNVREKSQFQENNVQNPEEIFTLAAKNAEALTQLIATWCDFLDSNSNSNLGEICYNTHVRRTHHAYRLAIIASDLGELQPLLQMLRNDITYQHAKIYLSDDPQKTPAKKRIDNLLALETSQLAALYVQNAKIDWRLYESNRKFSMIDMPLYPWQHKTYWPPLGTKKIAQVTDNHHPLRGRQLQSPLENLQFEFTASLELLPDLKDTYNILHAGYYLEILAFSVKSVAGQFAFTIEDHQFLSPLIVAPNTTLTIQLILQTHVESGYQFAFYSQSKESSTWVLNATGKLTLGAILTHSPAKITEIKARCSLNEQAEQLYARITKMGMPAGESIRWTNQYWVGQDEIICEFRPPICASRDEQYQLGIHPSVFDASIQPLFRLLSEENTNPYIAAGAKKVHFFGSQQGPYYLWGQLKSVTNDQIVGNCYLMNDAHQVIACFEEIILKQLDNRLHVDQILQSKPSIDLATVNYSQRRTHIENFLIEQISIIFSIPKEDIVTHHTLSELGIDSLMALVLARAIEVGLEMTYPMHQLLAGPSITVIVDSLSNSVPNTDSGNDSSSDSTAWISYRKNISSARFKLFCFPYGGGGASIYRDWQAALPDFIEVCPIQLPGREEKLDQKPIGDIRFLIDSLTRDLQSEFDMPFAFFGHSFGSLIAFELTRALRRQSLPMPKHLFVSAFPDPRIPTSSLDRLLKELAAINIGLKDIDHSEAVAKLSHDQLLKLSAIFNDNGIIGYEDYLLEKEIIKVLLPIFIGDMGIVKSFSYYQESPLEMPVTVFAGKQDKWVDYNDHFAWQDHTTDRCEIITFDRGHMFIKENDILQQIQRTITDKLQASLEEIEEIVVSEC